MLPDDGAQSKLLEDYEDYYDRSIKLRVMENQTLREQLEEHETSMNTLQVKHQRFVKFAWLSFVVFVIFLIEQAFPDVLSNAFMYATHSPQTFLSHGLCMGLVWFFVR